MKYLVVIGFIITFISLKVCMSEIADLHARVKKLESPGYIDGVLATQDLKQDIAGFQKCVERCG